MKRALTCTVTLAIGLSLTGCGGWRMSTDEMKELSEARETCAKLGGRFEQWPTDFGAGWRCDFDEEDR